MEVKLPEKRGKKDSTEFYTLSKLYFDKSIRMQVCVFNAVGYRKAFYYPFDFLSDENKNLIEEFNKTKEKKQSPVKSLIETQEEVKTSMKNKKRALPKTPQKEIKEIKKPILASLGKNYKKGNYLFDKPVKIIGCDFKDHLVYYVLFNCKQEVRNPGVISHDVMIQKFPELLIEYLAKSKVRLG
jgi:hypothetical protein